MMETVQSFPRAFAVWFKDLSRWDAASFHGISWHWPKEVMAPIGSVLEARKEKVDRSKSKFSELQPITIHFDGSVDPRKVDENREYSMEMFFAHPGDIVVAKIDLKNGAVGIVPENLKNVVVTNHFAVYRPNLSKVLPEYLHRLIQTSFFKSYLWRNKVGAEGRKEVKLDFFEAIDIPLPSISIQRAILERWHKAQYSTQAAALQVKQIKAEIDQRIYTELGLESPKPVKRPKTFAVLWGDFKRWSLNYNQARQSGVDLTLGTYPVVTLNSLLNSIQYGTSEKANVLGQGVPILRINNIKEGEVNFADLKHIELRDEELESLTLKDGDILIIRTSGSRGLVGTCGVFRGEGQFVYASYLIRLQVDPHKAIPEFVAWFINSDLGRQQVDAISRQIMMSNINSEEISELEIPLPPLEIQRSVVGQLQEGRLAIERERRSAEQTARGAEAELEALILGAKKLE